MSDDNKEQPDVSSPTEMAGLTSTVKEDGNIIVAKSDCKYISIPYNKKNKYFMNPVDYVKFIKATELMVRQSQEYVRYIAYLKNDVGLRSCALFHNIDDSMATIEMHHGPIFTLYDIIEIQIAHLFKTNEPVNSANVAHNVLVDHFNNIIQIVMLSEMAHKGVHNFLKNPTKENSDFFLSTDSAFGDMKKFTEKYYECFTMQHIMKIKNYLKLYDEYSKTPNKKPMFTQSVTEWSTKFS